MSQQPLPVTFRRYMKQSDLLWSLRNNAIRLSTCDFWPDANDRMFVNEYERRMAPEGRVHVLCLTDAPETVHHWNGFAAEGKGVCLEIKAAPFLKSLKQALPTARHEPVTYLKHNDFDANVARNTAKLPFIKRFGFSDEREFRVIYTDIHDEFGKHRPTIPLEPAMIARIHLGPGMTAAAATAFKQKLSGLRLAHGIRVSHATLFDNKIWQTRLKKART